MQINGDQMSVSPDRRVAKAAGNVEVLYGDALLTCDQMTLFTDTHDIYAQGAVRLEEGNQVFRGEMIHYNFDTKKGRFLQGTMSSPPWHQHGRSVEHIAEGIYEVSPGYVTSCEFEPPHFKFAGSSSVVFAEDKIARGKNVALIVDQVPFIYLPWLTVADRQSPFYLIPGKRKPWGHYTLMGYRYELPGNHHGTYKMDWRRHFGWGFGMDHQFETERLGQGLVKVYYNDLKNRSEPDSALPKGADEKRYRALWRHTWKPFDNTSMITDIQEFSDKNFRKELLFREEFSEEDETVTFGFGALGTAIGLLFVSPEIKSLFDQALKVIGLFMGVLGGLFALGVLTRRASGWAALIGALVGATVMGLLPFYSNINGVVYAAIGIAVCFGVGYLLSLILPARTNDIEGLTIYTQSDGPAPENPPT
ncbi:MAG: hypothetical protein IH898_02640 [Planctomycetes bacterium]|nr:hypothetical protein [Planctomycetota bacterium]